MTITHKLNTVMQAWRRNVEVRSQLAFGNSWEQTEDMSRPRSKVSPNICKIHCMHAIWLTACCAVVKITRLWGWLSYPVVCVNWIVFVAWLYVLAGLQGLKFSDGLQGLKLTSDGFPKFRRLARIVKTDFARIASLTRVFLVVWQGLQGYISKVRLKSIMSLARIASFA